MSEKPTYKRRNKLPKPRLQLRIIGAFAALSVVSILLELMILGSQLTVAAERLPGGGAPLMELMPQMMTEILVYSLLVHLPATMAVGILVTFPLVGPIYRFEQYLKGVIQGTQLGPCKIRKGDDLHELCDLINQATEPARQRHADDGAEAPDHEAPEDLAA